MNLSDVLLLVATGTVFGILGQSIRVIVGLKKRMAKLDTDGKTTPAFSWSAIFFSLFIGGVAGVLAVFFATDMTMPGKDEDTTNLLLGIMAAGYAGADFIEGAAGKLGLR